jgi:hypothetical protein
MGKVVDPVRSVIGRSQQAKSFCRVLLSGHCRCWSSLGIHRSQELGSGRSTEDAIFLSRRTLEQRSRTNGFVARPSKRVHPLMHISSEACALVVHKYPTCIYRAPLSEFLPADGPVRLIVPIHWRNIGPLVNRCIDRGPLQNTTPGVPTSSSAITYKPPPPSRSRSATAEMSLT